MKNKIDKINPGWDLIELGYLEGIYISPFHFKILIHENCHLNTVSLKLGQRNIQLNNENTETNQCIYFITPK